MKKYQPNQIEQKWQDKWSQTAIYQAQNDPKKPKKYILDMFPYPSGDGLHVGHFKIYNASDILARYFRLNGFNVLHPMGWDAFGLNAENYAIKNQIHPDIIVRKSINNIRRQMKMVGFSYDWSREIATIEPEYYKWTQWIFLKLYERGLAYQAEAPINWCPKDKTGLANEEVIGGKCERCGSTVERKIIRQWILKITEYADRLAEDVQNLDWPQFIKDMQINWIGKSQGTRIEFLVENKDYQIEVFTTRPDTLMGTTALVLAPEHPKTLDLVTDEHQEQVKIYIDQVKNKSDLERTELNKEKTGVFSGSFALNPVNNQPIPIWIADYVLGFYGTGAVMFVPAHDRRDFEFGQKFDIDIKQVIKPKDKPDQLLPYIGTGILVNSGEFDGLDNQEAKKIITGWLKQHNKGDFKVQYKLRDWVFSRQRYWGEPIPIIHCAICGIVPVSVEQLPVTLPDVEKYEPTGTGDSPLASIEEWVQTSCPKCGGPARRETNTMPQWAGSCWYYLRFCDTKNDQKFISEEAENYWMPVDWYLGGAEHAVLHLLYSRFWHKVLFDGGYLSTSEPFTKLSSVGLVKAPDGRKMSKSLGNVIAPDDIVNEYGADTLRIYEAFMGPFENAIAWDPSSINGSYKFLTRIWEIIQKDDSKNSDSQTEIGLNRLIKKVGQDIEQIKLNTAIASMMEYLNLVYSQGLTRDQKKRLLIILAPFVPHIAEELWQLIGEKYSIHAQTWPSVDEANLHSETVNLAVQVNGRVRDVIKVEFSRLSEKDLIEGLALKSSKVQKFLDGKQPKKVFYIPGKVISIVV